jgi:RNA-directed DNA polymerase
MGDGRQLATALADAMLAGPWESDPLRDRLGRVIAGRRSWLTALAREVLEAYPRPPSDRPRELAAFVLGSAALERGRRTAEGLPRPVVRLSAPTVTVRRPFPTPVVDHVGALAERLEMTPAELETLADTRLLARRATSARIANYRYQWLQRTTGARLLEAPRPRLAAIQRTVLDDLLAPIPVHPAAHGFVASRSAITGAAVHAGAAVVITLDLEHFFSSITAGRIWGVLRAAGYPEPVAHLLAGLTTHAAPVSALRSMPRGPDSARDFRLRRRLATPHLPQGAPSSPQLANLVAYSLDRRIDAYSHAAGIRYTRYADDLTLSGGPELARRRQSLLNAVETIVFQEGFRLNPAKTRMRQRHQRQVVTGIVVNDHPNLARPEFDRLKAILHDCLLHGPTAANRQHHNHFRAHLLGRISWVAALNPARGARLRATFDAVSWEQ